MGNYSLNTKKHGKLLLTESLHFCLQITSSNEAPLALHKLFSDRSMFLAARSLWTNALLDK